VKVELLHTGGSAENIKLLEDANSGVKIGFTQGGISNSERAPKRDVIGSDQLSAVLDILSWE
jgi:hypothetical protein